MIAAAQFIANPVLEEVRRLYESRQTGVLALGDEKGERVSVSFREGIIEAASSNKGARRLSDYLVKAGLLTARDLETLLADSVKRNMVIGETIVRKRVLSHGEVGEAARRQSLDLIRHTLNGHFKVSSFTNSLCSYHVPAGITFPHVLLDLSRIDGQPFDDMPGIHLVIASDSDLTAFPWHPEELFVLTELKTPRTFVGLLTATKLEENVLKKILGVLERVGVIRSLSSVVGALPEDNSIMARDQLALEVLIPSVTNAVLDEKVEVATNEHSFASEQFRNLKIQLRHAESETERKVFTVSSPDAQDGKSLISVNLAFSFAQDPGCRVLIIDCDLRRPSLDRYLGVSTHPGLLQYLSSGPLRPHCFIRRLENLYFMTAGGTSPNPIEALSMHRMKELIEQLRAQFDTIILDAPPYSPIADARVVTALSDGLIMVVRSGRTAYSSTDRAMKMIDQKKLLGVVLNDVKAMPFTKTYQNYGYYQYNERQLVVSADEKLRRPKNLLEP